MSYINDALHKVQKEKKSSYAPYGDVVSADVKKPDPRQKWLTVIGLLLVFLFAAGIIALLYWPDGNKNLRVVIAVQKPVVAAVPPLTNSAGQDVPPVTASAPKPEAPQAMASVNSAAPIPVKVEKAPLADRVLPAEVKEKKQTEAIPEGSMKQAALSKPTADEAEIIYAQALQKQREGKLEEAKELYRSVIKQEPRNLQAQNNLGVVYLKLKRYQRAILCFTNALKIKPDYVDAHYNLACLYAQKNDTKQSLLYLKNAIAINPEVRLWAADDGDLKGLAKLPEFNKLVQTRDN